MLEIGVYAGESLRYFREFFTHLDTRIIGADGVGLLEGSEPGDNFVLEKDNQRDLNFLNRLINVYGSFDIIMADVSHGINLTKTSFKTLWPYVKEGGFI